MNTFGCQIRTFNLKGNLVFPFRYFGVFTYLSARDRLSTKSTTVGNN